MSGSLLDDSGEPSSYPGVFAFEFDFGGTLRCIPMSVRLKLDQVGIKLSLKQWNKMPSEERRYLVEAPCDDPADMDTYRRRLRALIEKFTASPVEEVPVDVSPPWADPGVVPERIGVWARNLGLESPSARDWAALTPLQRFALYKLTRPGHSNDNFIPAMREFELLR